MSASISDGHPSTPIQQLSQIAVNATPAIIAAAPRAVRNTLGSTPTRDAVAQCIAAGLFALITPSQASTAPFALPEHLAEFVQDADVARELAKLLNGEVPNPDELTTIFTEVTGYTPASIDIALDRGVSACAAAFASALSQEPELAQVETLMQAQARLRQHGRLSEAVLQQLNDAVAKLRQLAEAANSTNTLTANDIHAQNVVVGAQNNFHQHFYAERAPKWEEHYLRTLIARCDALDLAPIEETRAEEDSKAAPPVRIGDVFTTLFLRGVQQGRKRGEMVTVADAIGNLFNPLGNLRSEDPLRKSNIRVNDDAEVEKDELAPIQAVEAMAAVPRLVILGQPGGGKSSLINHVAAQLARRRLGEPMADERLLGWDKSTKPLPVRILLREFAAWLAAQSRQSGASGNAGLVWSYLQAMLNDWGCTEAFTEIKTILTSAATSTGPTSGMVCFDGLDEVRAGDEAALRETILQAIVAFAEPLTGCKIVVTCREYAYQPADRTHADWRLPVEQFPFVALRPFDTEQIQQFIQDWYRVIGPRPPRFWDAARCEAEASRLSDEIAARPYLQDLAENPLLLTLMTQVHGRDGELPNDRADLYERAVKLLLDRWEARLEREASGRGNKLANIYQTLRKSPEEVLFAIQAIAYEAHRQQAGEGKDQRALRRPAAIDRLRMMDQLSRSLAITYNDALEVAEFIQQRAGLLIAQSNGDYSFPHRTFQEYLAARHLMRQYEPHQRMCELVTQDLEWWREVYLLAAGIQRKTAPSVISSMAEELVWPLTQLKALTADQSERAVLVAQALYETHFVDEAERSGRDSAFARRCAETRTALLCAMQSYDTLTPVQRAEAGNALAQIGDPRFDPQHFYLPNDDWLGFVHIPADPEFKIGTRSRDFERVMQVIGVEEGGWDSWRAEINDAVSPTSEFYMARYPVTVAQWRAYVADSQRVDAAFRVRDKDSLDGIANHPAIWINWYEARAFCAWLNEQFKTSHGVAGSEIARMVRSGHWQISLPSELEWEKAARAGNADGIWPWGDEPKPNLANYAASQINTTSTAGCFPANGFGCQDLIGNVWEWTRSNNDQPDPNDNDKTLRFYYPYDVTDGRENVTAPATWSRVLRGGSWDGNRQDARCAFRYFDLSPVVADGIIGFRVVLSPVSSSPPLVSDPLNSVHSE